MKKILIVEDDFDLRELLEIVIESEFDNPILAASSGNEAIEILKKDSNVGVIISDLFMHDGNGADVFKYNQSSLNVPFLLITGDADNTELCLEALKDQNLLSAIIYKPWKDTDLLVPLRKVIANLSKVSVEDFEDLEFKKISVNNVLTYQAFEFNYYTKRNDFDYIPLRECHSNISTFLKENRKSNIFLSSMDFDKFIKISVQNLSRKSKVIAKIGDFFKISASVLNLLVQGSKTLNIQPEDFEIINSYVEKQFDILSCKDNLKKQVESLKNSHGYLVGHSLISILVSSAILKGLGYSEETVISKLIQASLLHDISLDSDFLSSIFSKESDEFKSLDDKNKKLVLDHPLKISNQLDQTGEYSVDVIKMIRYHHIIPGGNGFPENIAMNNINLVVAIFSISVMASDIYYREGFTDLSQKLIVSNLAEDYMVGEFECVAICLIDIIG